MSPNFGGEPRTPVKERDDVVARFRVGGSLDLRRATPSERRFVFHYFETHQDAIPREQYLEFLEEGLGHGELDGATIERIVPKLTLAEQIQLGLFIMESPPDARLHPLFAVIMHGLPREAQQLIVHDAKHTSAYARMLVAPFTLPLQKGATESSQEFHTRFELVESLLKDTEENVVESLPMLLDHLMTTAQRFESPEGIVLIRRLFNSTPNPLRIVFFPYVPLLIRWHIIQPTWVDEYVAHDEHELFLGYGKGRRFFLNPAQVKKSGSQPLLRTVQQSVGNHLIKDPEAWLSSSKHPEETLATMVPFDQVVTHLDALHADSAMVCRIILAYQTKMQRPLAEYSLAVMGRVLEYAHRVGGESGRAHVLTALQTWWKAQTFGFFRDGIKIITQFDAYRAVLGSVMDEYLVTLYNHHPEFFIDNLKVLEHIPGCSIEQWLVKLKKNHDYGVLAAKIDLFAKQYAACATERVTTHELVHRVVRECPAAFFSLPRHHQALFSEEDVAGCIASCFSGEVSNYGVGSAMKGVMAWVITHRGFDGLATLLNQYPIALKYALEKKEFFAQCTDKQLGMFLKKYPAVLSDLMISCEDHTLLYERVFSLPVTDLVGAYQYIIHRQPNQLIALYDRSLCERGRAGFEKQEHQELLWRFVRESLDTDKGLLIAMEGINTESDVKKTPVMIEHATWPIDHFKLFKRKVNEGIGGFLIREPRLIFDPVLKKFKRVEGFFTEEVMHEIEAQESLFARYRQFEYEPEDGTLTALMAMETSPLFQQHTTLLEHASTRDLARIAEKFRYIVIYNHDTPALEAATTVQDLEHTVDERIKAVALQYFGFDERSIHEHTDIDVIMTMGKYVKTHEYRHPDIVQATHKFVPLMQHPEFKTWRAWGTFDTLDHRGKEKQVESMKRRGLIPEKATLVQYEAWVRDEQSSLEVVYKSSLEELCATIDQITFRAVLDGHVPDGEFGEDYETLEESVVMLSEHYNRHKRAYRAFLKDYPKGEQTMPFALHRAFEQARSALHAFESNYKELLKKQKARYYVMRLSRLSATELESQSVRVGEGIITINAMIEYARAAYYDTEFVADLESIQHHITTVREELFGGVRVSRKVLSATDHVDAHTYLHIGEKPCKTCQAPTSGMSVGLLSYVLDPQNKCIQVYADGTLSARAIMRFIEDGEGNPVIFLERVYSDTVHHAITDMILDIARKKARAMHVPLMGDSESYAHTRSETPHTVVAHGSRTPYTYSDAGGRMCKKGKIKASAITL